MDKYRSLVAWQRAHLLARRALQITDAAWHPRHKPLFDPIRRAAISVEANIVEGYALGTTPYFLRHLRIAMGSAAEFECLVRLGGELSYLSRADATELEAVAGDCMRAVRGLLRATTPPSRG